MIPKGSVPLLEVHPEDLCCTAIAASCHQHAVRTQCSTSQAICFPAFGPTD